MARDRPTLEVQPLTPARWPDLEDLFGPSGACSGCWCMYWRITRRQLAANGNRGNRRALRRLVDGGTTVGLLGYRDGRADGWVCLAPREEFPSLDRSRVLARLDDEPVWSLVCLFVRRQARGAGLAEALVGAAVDHARRQGARWLEAYPSQPEAGRLPPEQAYMGTPELFARCGFAECAAPSRRKRVMRRPLA